MEMMDNEFMERAIELSIKALEERAGNPFGSVVVKDGRIVGEGWNEVHRTNDPSAHAEMLAIRDASQRLGTPRLQGCVVYASGQPCPMCLALIYLAGIDKVYYCIPGSKMTELNPALSVDFIYEALGTEPKQRPVPEVQLMADKVDDTIRRYREVL